MKLETVKLTAKIALVATIAMLIAQAAFGQAGQSELSGRVTDATGAAIAGAQVTLNEIGMNRTAQTTTDDAGTYLFTNQRAGSYSVTFHANGFARLVNDGVTLTTGERIRLDARLQVEA